MLMYDSDWIVEHVCDVKTFAKDLTKVVAQGIQTGDFSALKECILDWEAIAEINAIPGARERILEGYKSIESGEDDNDLPTWDEFMKEMGMGNE